MPPSNATLAPPPPGRLAWEALSPLQLARLALRAHSLGKLPRGDAPVIVLPGFRADDLSTLPLRWFLRRLGHEVEGWGLGINRGDVPSLMPRVVEAVGDFAERRGRRVHLIGQSLGGVLAREAARDRPDAVAQVVTLGTPVVGGPSYTIFAGAYSPQTRAAIDAAIERRERVPIRVPLTAVYSRRDGIVSWEACIDRHNGHAKHVEVTSSHLAMGLDPVVWRLAATLVADARPPS
jgi:pimeloyl-ACP methyl ester carboxylesterase